MFVRPFEHHIYLPRVVVKTLIEVTHDNVLVCRRFVVQLRHYFLIVYFRNDKEHSIIIIERAVNIFSPSCSYNVSSIMICGMA